MQVSFNLPRDPLRTGLLASRSHRTLLRFQFAVGYPPYTADRPAQRDQVYVAVRR